MSSYPFNPDPSPKAPPFEAAIFYLAWFGGLILVIWFWYFVLPNLRAMERNPDAFLWAIKAKRYKQTIEARRYFRGKGDNNNV